jgi:hypothetical protein
VSERERAKQSAGRIFTSSALTRLINRLRGKPVKGISYCYLMLMYAGASTLLGQIS